MDISIIIATYNRKDFLKDSLSSLFNQNYPKNKYEIIVVDDGSKDGTKKMVQGLKFRGNLHYFYQKNKGQAAAMNLGIKNAKGEIIAFTDDDCVASKDWLVELMKGFKDNHDIAGVGGEIIAFNPQNLIEKYWDIFFFDQKETIEDKKNRPSHLIGANCAYRAEIFQKVGLFDYSLTSQLQDVDFGWRLSWLGYQFLYLPEMIVFHRMPKTFWQFLKKNFIAGCARTEMLAKHQNRLKQNKEHESSIDIVYFIGKDLTKLSSWPERIVDSYDHIPVRYHKEKLMYLLIPFLNVLGYRTLRLGMVYQSLKLRKK
jgi:GT2 family glycosyltransferase